MHKIFGIKKNITYTDREGAYLIPIRNNQIGVIQNPKGYFFLGGGLEKNESHEMCIKRECLKEAGRIVGIEKKICSAEAYIEHEVIGHFHPMQTYYVGQLLEKVQMPIEKEHMLVWIAYEQLKGDMYLEMQNWALEKSFKQRIVLYEPQVEDLWFTEKLMNDEETMSYNHAWGGTIPFPKEKWKVWYDKWMINHENKRYYRYVKENNNFIGEIAYHFDDERKIYIAHVIIHAAYRGKGYGKAALMLLCEQAKSNGVTELYDDIAIDNPSVSLFVKCGFEEVYRTDEYIMVKKKL